ncbi:MAG: cardiolipin synthase B [Planctomycetota bacterium]|nr:MAG: cardiolipin synthase B [Planctomycetota bacterium]
MELLPGGACFYPHMLDAIDTARTEVLVATYLWESDELGRKFVAALMRAARRDVAVRVIVDGVGSRGLTAADRRALERSGAEFAVYHPVNYPGAKLFRRLHKKLLLVDGTRAYVGGAGFADAWVATPPAGWWDLMVELRGPVLALLRQDFARDWRKTSSRTLPEIAEPARHGDEALMVLVSRYGRPQLRRQLVRRVLRARQSVDITAAYFVPGPGLRRALRRAARRGVRVRLLLPGARTDHFAVWSAGRRHYAKLLKLGVQIHEWQPGMLHAKYAVIDDDWGFVGSSNLDNWSLRSNAELDVTLRAGPALRALSARFALDLEETRCIDAERWRDRPLGLRIAETFFGWFDPLL